MHEPEGSYSNYKQLLERQFVKSLITNPVAFRNKKNLFSVSREPENFGNN